MTGRWSDGLAATGPQAVELMALAWRPGSPVVVVAGETSVAAEVVREACPGASLAVVAVDDFLVGASGSMADTHVIVDASSLPTRTVLAVLRRALDQERDGRFVGPVQVLICQGAAADGRAGPGRAGRPEPSGPERGVGGLFVPVLSEGSSQAVLALYRELAPDDVCPVLPFPSRDTRRSDDLVLEHRRLLFEQMQVEVRNFIYAHESDPFDLYRTLISLWARRNRWSPGRSAAQLCVFPGWSVLPAIGAFLAAYELSFPVVWPTAANRTMMSSLQNGRPRSGAQLSCAWLAGGPYREVQV